MRGRREAADENDRIVEEGEVRRKKEKQKNEGKVGREETVIGRVNETYGSSEEEE